MFELAEHHALIRLMTRATGFNDGSPRIAHWLQEWDRSANPRTITPRVPGLSGIDATDVQEVAKAAKRTGAKPSTLGRLEYLYKMENIARAYPLPTMEYER